MRDWIVVQRNKETGEEKTFYSDGASKIVAEMAADIRTKIVSASQTNMKFSFARFQTSLKVIYNA